MPETRIEDEEVPLPWEFAVPHLEAVKLKAARQFISIWRKHKDRFDAPETLRWGEEVEYLLLDLSGEQPRAALRADEVLRRLGPDVDGGDPCTGAGWRTEYGNMMVEGVTHPPFSWSLRDIAKVERSLAWRRHAVSLVAREVDQAIQVVTLATFPLLGVPGSTAPPTELSPDGDVSKSVLCPDQATSPHPRYQAFTANFRKRKGCKVGAFIPEESANSEDSRSESRPTSYLQRLPFLLDAGSPNRDPLPGYIYMDSQAFGACQCCMQATFGCKDLQEARFLTDQLLVLAPLFLALSAATPFHRGRVAATDTRWPAFTQTWDDRTEGEVQTIKNSRVSANDLFLSAGPEGTPEMNDVEVPIHEASLSLLREAGVDELLSNHVAHLLVRDPIMVFEHLLGADDEESAHHWEHLQGTNWGTVRFKPPPAGSSGIGWRVEFRSPDVQMTDYENAALVVTIRLLVDAIVEEGWDLAIPISRCDENDEASGQLSAASRCKFWFRQDVRVPRGGEPACARSLHEILSDPTAGIFTLLRQRLDRDVAAGKCPEDVRSLVEGYLCLWERRAAGELPTTAEFFRARLERHAEYAKDGVLPLPFAREMCELAANSGGCRPGAEAGGLSDLLGGGP